MCPSGVVGMRAVVLTNILSPYRVSLFNAVAEQLQGELTVLCAARSEPLRLWGTPEARQLRFRYRVLPGVHFSWMQREWHIHLNWGLGRALRALRPDVLVLGGYEQLLYWQGLHYARRRGIPTVLWYESWEGSAQIRRGMLFALKRAFVRQVRLGLAYGNPAARWLQRIHGGELPTVVIPNTVDMEFFRRSVWQIRQTAEFASRRAQYPPLLLLYVGRLIPLKNVALLLEALRLLQDPGIGLLVVGEGPERETLARLSREYGLQDVVVFEGHRQPEELPWWYALADVLVLPSLREVWGLVVNEALAAGLYVLCSTAVGAAYDLLQPGWNGALFDPGDAEALAALIQQVSERHLELRQRREAISEHACRHFGIERAAEGFLEALHQAYACRC